MARAVLDVVASGAVASPADVGRYVRCTLLCATKGFEAVRSATQRALEWIEGSGFIR
jgi:DNA polymerase theta